MTSDAQPAPAAAAPRHGRPPWRGLRRLPKASGRLPKAIRIANDITSSKNIPEFQIFFSKSSIQKAVSSSREFTSGHGTYL